MDAFLLATTFDAVEALFLRLDGPEPPSEEQIQTGIQQVVACSRAIRELGVLSANEEAADMLTEDLRYLLAEFFIGRFTLASLSASNRLKQVCEAKLSFEAFVRACEVKGLVSDLDFALLGVEEEEPGLRRAPRRQPITDMRMLKIQRFKAASAARKRLAELSSGGIDRDDETVRRERTLALIECCISQAVDELVSIRNVSSAR